MIAGTQEVASAVELDRGPRAGERTRMCAVTREIRPLSELIRFVVGPDGAAVPDVKTKLPGRGLWITASREALGEAIKRKVFGRGFKREVRLPPDLAEQTERLLERAVLDALAMAGKAGSVAAGFAKTEAALEHEEVIAVLHAAGASADGVRKLQARAQPSPVGGTARGDWIFDHGAIGFGIEPPKCGTCCPARRTCERNLFGALPAPGAVSHRRSATSGRKGCAEVTPAGDMNAYD